MLFIDLQRDVLQKKVFPKVCRRVQRGGVRCAVQHCCQPHTTLEAQYMQALFENILKPLYGFLVHKKKPERGLRKLSNSAYVGAVQLPGRRPVDVVTNCK